MWRGVGEEDFGHVEHDYDRYESVYMKDGSFYRHVDVTIIIPSFAMMDRFARY